MERMGLLFDNQKEVIERQLLKFESGITGWMYGYRIHPIKKNPDGTPLRQLHNGVDLPNPTGYPIKAPFDGKVTKCWNDDKNGGGFCLVLEHENAMYAFTGYAHLSGYAASITIGMVGNQFKQGDIIAYVGNTGVGTGPHLHFTARTAINGILTTVDSLPQLCAACGVVELPIHQVG